MGRQSSREQLLDRCIAAGEVLESEAKGTEPVGGPLLLLSGRSAGRQSSREQLLDRCIAVRDGLEAETMAIEPAAVLLLAATW